MNIYFPLKKILKKLGYKIKSGQFKGVPVLKKANNLSFSPFFGHGFSLEKHAGIKT